MKHPVFLLLLLGAIHCPIRAATASAQDANEQLALHQERAREAEKRQDFATAVREYRLLVNAVPNSAELLSNLGVALYFNRDFKEAVEILRRSETLKPGLYTPHVFIGLAMTQLGKPDDAVRELEKAVEINGADPLAHFRLGLVYTAQSRFDMAAEQMQIAVEEKPDDQEAWFALGRSSLELAKGATIELLHVAPDGGRTWALAGEQYEAQGRREQAVKAYAGALERRPDLPDVAQKIADLGGTVPATRRGDGGNDAEEDRLYDLVHVYQARAAASFERVAQIDPDSFRAHEILGDSYLAADRFDDAILEYGKVLERKPDLPGAHRDLCDALSRTGRIAEAIKECDAEIEVSPYSADAYVDAARLRAMEDDNVRAAVLVEKALGLDRPPAAAYKLKGRVDLAQKHYPAAIEALRHYLQLEGSDPGAWFLLARAYKAVGNSTMSAQAIESYKKTSDAEKATREVQQALQSHDNRDGSSEDELREGSPL